MLIIYHDKDLDGICSAAVILKAFPEHRLIGYDYGRPFDVESEIENDEMVVMVDVSMPMDVMEAIAERSGRFTWIDHHVSAHKDFMDYFGDYRLHEDGGMTAVDGQLTYVYENGRAACELCWEWIMQGDIPEPVLLLGEYDTWRNSDKDRWGNYILPFQYGMRIEGFTPDSLANWLFNDYKNNPTRGREIIGIGKAILKYQQEANAYGMKGSFDARLNLPDGQIVRCLVCNRVPSNSMSFESKWDEEKYDIMIPIGFDGQKWGLSFYTTKDTVDCSMLAKLFGGGGHKKAAGCATDDLRRVLVW